MTIQLRVQGYVNCPSQAKVWHLSVKNDVRSHTAEDGALLRRDNSKNARKQEWRLYETYRPESQAAVHSKDVEQAPFPDDDDGLGIERELTVADFRRSRGKRKTKRWETTPRP